MHDDDHSNTLYTHSTGSFSENGTLNIFLNGRSYSVHNVYANVD